MKLEQIIKLKELGFSTDDILKLAPMMEADLKEEAPVKEEPKPEVLNVEVKKPAVDLDAVMGKLNDLTTLIHASNISSSTAEQPKTAEDVIAEIINPSYKK